MNRRTAGSLCTISSSAAFQRNLGNGADDCSLVGGTINVAASPSGADLADKIAIPQLWFSREDVLRYCNGEVPATEFLNLRTDVIYRADEPEY
jgi:hypothetical protein